MIREVERSEGLDSTVLSSIEWRRVVRREERSEDVSRDLNDDSVFILWRVIGARQWRWGNDDDEEEEVCESLSNE